MKSYKEVAADVLQRSEIMIAERRKRRSAWLKAGSGAVCLVLIALLGFVIWQKPDANPFPPNGEVQFSEPLKGAMAEDNTLYKVAVYVYKDQKAGKADLQKERDRLQTEGYSVDLREDHILLYATKGQLTDFSSSDEYGYSVQISEDLGGRPKYYTRAAIAAALMARLSGKSADEELLETVLLPTSLGIRLPHIDGTRILSETLLRESMFYDDFWEELSAHGLSRKEMEAMTYGEYNQLHDGWVIGEAEQAEIANEPYFAGRDPSTVVWWEYDVFQKSKYESRFNEEELAELARRGIREDDASWLLKKEYYFDTEAFLAESDAVLREKIRQYYQLALYMEFDEETAEAIIAAAA